MRTQINSVNSFVSPERACPKSFISNSHSGTSCSFQEVFSNNTASFVPSGGAAVYAGRPGKKIKKTLCSSLGSGLIEDWHRCVKHLNVSSRESQAHKLIDGSGGYWQSSGSQGKVSNLIFSSTLLCGNICCQVHVRGVMINLFVCSFLIHIE